jgi:hypothetical protein
VNEEILNGVSLGPDHEKKEPGRALAWAVFSGLIMVAMCAGGCLATIVILAWRGWLS